MTKKKLPKTTKTRSHHKIKKVKLPKDTVLRIEAPAAAVPVVVASAPGIVDVVAVHEKMGWMEYLFGK